MSETAYNGWEGKGNRASAYATWRVMLELVDTDSMRDVFDEKPTTDKLADFIEDSTSEFVRGEDYNEERIATQYAMAFLDDVSWEEIAEHILSDWED